MSLITEKPNFEQPPLIEAAFIKFAGTSNGTLDNPPAIDDEKTYVVKAKCKAHHKDRRADGEDRLTVTMEILDVWERGRQPIVDEEQATLFDDAMAMEAAEEAADAANGDPYPDGADEDADEPEAADPDEDQADDDEPDAAAADEPDRGLHSVPSFSAAD